MSQQLQITGGAKVRDLQDVIIGTSGVLSSLAFNVANGVPKLDVNGKILVSQLPNSVMEYQGTWNAATNTPTLVNGTGNQGDVYLCNVAGTTNFGAGPITFAVGDSAIYSGTIWQRAGGATGTVTSVGLTSTGNDAITITGSPITTSGNINLGFAGTNLQYINGAGDLTTFPTLISSIGLSMPSAFSVANSPLTSNGTIAVTGAGVASQYIRGDGTLADFPTSGGGGSSVSYYLNGGTSQGTIGGVTYYEMSKTADTGTMADFSLTGNGFIVAFLTDAGDPAQLNIPAGNWNYEIYASMSANGGTPEMYAELYKYDGTTFTLIATSPHEILYDGTALNLYTFAMTVPSTTLAITDRLAVKLYATNSGGKTTTVHTQDSHLCQIITTFSTGITALNGLTAQVQYFATGTSGTDFNISSTTATHTFNIPSASATNRGLITTGSQTIAGDKAFTGINSFDYGINYKTGASLANVSGYISQAYATSGTGAGSTLSLKISDGNSVKAINLDFVGAPATYTYTFPAASGTLAILEAGTQTFTGTVNVLGSLGTKYGISIEKGNTPSPLTFNDIFIYASSGATNIVNFANSSYVSSFSFPTSNQTFTYPAATGTLALTSDIPSLSNYVTLNGTQTISGNKTFSGINSFTGYTSFTYASTFMNGASLNWTAGSHTAGSLTLSSAHSGSTSSLILSDGDTAKFIYFSFTNTATGTKTYTLPDASGTLALTSDLGSYLPLTGGTLTGALSGTSATFSGNVLIGSTSNDFGKLDITTSNAVGFTSALGIGFRTNVAEGDSVGISFKTKISLGGTIWENARIAAITESIATSANGALAFYTMNATVLGEKMRITPSGNIGINTISPNAALDIAVDGSVLNYPRIYDKRTQAINQGAKLSLGGYSDNLTTITSFGQIVGAKTNATSGNTSGYLSFLTNSGSGLVEALRLSSTQEATFAQSVTAAAFYIPGANVAGSRNLIAGENTNTGTTGKIKAFLQNSTTTLHIEKYGTGYTTSGIATTAGSAIYDDGAGGMSIGATNGGGTLRLFSGGSEAMRINTSGVVTITNLGSGAVTATSGVLSATSDMNLKISDGYIDTALDKILKLTPRYFYWKEETGLPSDLRQLGFYAQEVNEAIGEEGANTPKGENDKWGIYDRAIIAMLTKAMQEQNELIEDLKARLDNAGL